MDLSVEEIIRLPGRHVTDHQMRLFMQFCQTDRVAAASAKASFSTATGHRLARDPGFPRPGRSHAAGAGRILSARSSMPRSYLC